MSQGDIDDHILGLIMASQYLLKKGIKLFGNRSKVVANKELRQIHNMDTYTPMDPKKLTWDQKS